MEYITLKNSDLKVSRLAMGGCPMGGHGWGKVEDGQLIDAVSKGLTMGVNFFDTADVYGLGKSEELLGKSLKGRRNHAVIASKFGVRIEKGVTYYDNSKEWIEKALRESLRRLDTDYIDLYQIHYLDRKTPMEEIIETLEKQRKMGYIRYFGLSNVTKTDKNELLPYKECFCSFQNEYSLACKKYEEDILTMEENMGLTPMTWGSLGQGILTGKYNKDTHFDEDDRRKREAYINFHGQKLEKNLTIVEEMKLIQAKINKPLSAIAIRYILDRLSKSVVIAGVKNSEQLWINCEAFGWHLENEELMQLESVSEG